MNIYDFGPMNLSSGSHAGPQDGMCLMEMVSFVNGEKWSASPDCACPVIAAYCRYLNDAMRQEWRDKLQNFVPRLIGTVSDEHTQERAEYLVMQAVTVFAPIALEKAGMHKETMLLRGQEYVEGAAAAAHAGAAVAHTVAVAVDDAGGSAALAAACDCWSEAIAALEGVLQIGPSGTAYTQHHIDRGAKLPELLGAA